MLKSFKGITLIALVVTIVVLLILAGVAITTLTGENGIITQAMKAKTKTEQAQEDELRRLTQLEAITHIEEYEYLEVSGKKVTIPAHCAVSQLEGENTLEGGLVIIDKNGNSWVWIEVPKSMEVYPSAGINITTYTDETYEKIYNDLRNYVKDFNNTSWKDEYFEGNIIGEEEEYKNLKNKMLKSIYENEGFFIGQYECGIEKSFRNYDEDFYNKHEIPEQPVIKQNAYPFNWVTIDQAQELTSRLSIGEKTTSLMFGIQWDLTLKFMSKKGFLIDGTKVTQDMLIEDSSQWANYKASEFLIQDTIYSEDKGKRYKKIEKYKKETGKEIIISTGGTKRNSILNIYDFAGNMAEWTLEYTDNSNNPYGVRGNSYVSNGSAGFRGGTPIGVNSESYGFRAVLY